MRDGECGGSRRARANPARDREHGQQLHRPDAAGKHTGRSASFVAQNGNASPRVASCSFASRPISSPSSRQEITRPFTPVSSRSVYDGQEHGLFMAKLDARIRNHDREIEKMCNHHFQGFVDSITELLKVRGEAQKLKSQVTATNRSIQGDGKELMSSMEELRQCRVQQRNIATTIDKLTHCLPVLEMYGRLQEQMDAKRYYPALRTSEQLEQTCLPRAGQYRFCAIMAENLPKLRTQIRDTAMTQLKDFLESIRKHSDKIGETAIRQAQLQRSLDSSISAQPRAPVGRRPRREAAAGGVAQSNGQAGRLEVDEEEADQVTGAQDLVDFSPVYRCLHIYTVLGLRDVFENYYRKQRRKQARLVLQPHSNMHETLEGYRRYFNQIVGFFVVEDHVLHTTQGLVNRAYVEELWELALSKIVAALRMHSSYCDDPDLVLDLKNLIVLFADTLQGYGFPVSQLFDMLLEMREQYSEILLKRWNVTFRQVLDQDNFGPILVSTEQEYRHYTSQFPLQDPELEKLPFPKKLPFSEFVPKVYCQLKEFIYACLKYSEDLHLSSTEVDDMIRKSTNLLLTRTLSHCLHYAIKKKNVGLAELVQVSINTTHLEQSCHFLEEFISNITNVPPDTANATKLYGTSTFKDARHAAEAEIYTGLNAKIDQFLQLADYDWMAGVPSGAAPTPSDYLLDLIAFLKSTFSVFTNLPGKVAQTACMSACKHISTSLLQLLLDPEVKQISMGALHQLNADVYECEGFARAGPVAGFQGDTLLLAFSDLRQLLELFTHWDWSSYLADYGKTSCKYLRVNPHAALALLEKMRESSRKNVVFAQFRKTERDRQKLIDAVAKQLRNLIAQHHT
ncbi:exocyst complex component 6B isoform X1 [Phycodurus eques]|uniref:exocyst complex component 6B isoform X1 n=1 Tax=Phycodurus eques TaxID=693459 RepID=UPI002ACE1552|nr:exocyst complex component 6B isoform X1 [Phycodurus eques]